MAQVQSLAEELRPGKLYNMSKKQKQINANEFDNREEIDNFLETHSPLKLNQEIDQLNRPVTESEIESVMINLPTNKSYDRPRRHIKKQRQHFDNKGPCSQSYGFSNSHVQMWEKWKLLSRVWLFVTPWTIYSPWNSPGQNTGMGSPSLLQGVPWRRSQYRDQTQVSCIAGRFFTSWATRKAQEYWSG